MNSFKSLILFLFVLSACTSNPSISAFKFKLSDPTRSLKIEEVTAFNSLKTQTAVAGNNGIVEYLPEHNPSFLKISKVDGTQWIMLPVELIKGQIISIDFDDFAIVEATGALSELAAFERKRAELHQAFLEADEIALDKPEKGMPEKERIALQVKAEHATDKAYWKKINFIKDYCETASDLSLRLAALQHLPIGLNHYFFQKYLKGLTTNYPEDSVVMAINSFEQEFAAKRRNLNKTIKADLALGGSLNFGDIDSDYVAVNFWRSNCGQSIVEMDYYQEHLDMFTEKGVSFVHIALQRDIDEVVEKANETNKSGQSFLIDEEGGFQTVVGNFDLFYIPTIYLYDGEGNYISSGIREGEWEEALKEL